MSEAVQEESVEQTTPTTAENMETTIKALKIQQKALSQLVNIHAQTLISVMISSNGVSELKKRQAAVALLEAIEFALDFGVNVTKPRLREGGEVFANQANNLAGVLVKALDNRMVLLADNMYKQEQEESQKESLEAIVSELEASPEVTEELTNTQETSNESV